MCIILAINRGVKVRTSCHKVIMVIPGRTCYTLYVYIIYTCIYTYTYVYSEVTFKLILSIKTFRLQYSIVNSLNIQYLIFNSSNILIMSTDSYTIDKSSFFIYFCFNFGIFYFLVIFLSFLKSKKPLEKQRQKYK